MTKSTLKVEARLEEKNAVWFSQRMLDTRQTKTELINQLVRDRILLEENPWKFISERMREPTKKTELGFKTLIPDFSGSEVKGGQNAS